MGVGMLENVTVMENHCLSKMEFAPYANLERKNPFQYISYALQSNKAAWALKGDKSSSSGLLLNDCGLMERK